MRTNPSLKKENRRREGKEQRSQGECQARKKKSHQRLFASKNKMRKWRRALKVRAKGISNLSYENAVAIYYDRMSTQCSFCPSQLTARRCCVLRNPNQDARAITASQEWRWSS
jgi:hypothetical protein